MGRPRGIKKAGKNQAHQGRALISVYQMFHQEKMDQVKDDLEAAKRIRAHQGNHECEVSTGGEGQLLQHYRSCQKNPGHSHFIPVQDFKKEDLPSGYHDNNIVDWIRAEADLTCRLKVEHASKNRPKHWPDRPHLLYPFSQDMDDDCMRTGTGWVSYVIKYTEEDNTPCRCEECSKPSTHTPHKVWGEIVIWTAKHVVFDDDEARHTTCYFGYDTSTTVLSRDCIKLTGFKVETSDVIQDRCKMTYVTHDMDTVNKLYKMWSHSVDLWKKVCDKYRSNKNTSLSVPRVSCLTGPKPCPVVVISHPHGLSKFISVGMWTHRQTWTEIKKLKFDDDWEADVVDASYTYNAHTCPGSSGAPVIRLPMKEEEWWRWFTYHPHKAGGEDNTNNNTCAVFEEFVSEPTRPEDK